MSRRIPASSSRRLGVVLAGVALFVSALAGVAVGHPEHDNREARKGVPVPATATARQIAAIVEMERAAEQAALPALGLNLCQDGTAAGYPCAGVDLASFVPLSLLGGGEGNDIWGWTDPVTQRDFAIMGRTSGVTFVEITNPTKPQVVGWLPTHSSASIWRDLKVYDNHVYIVSEAPASGLQVFDLRQLVPQKQRPYVFAETAYLGAWSSAHNIAINEASGYAYVVGSNTCSGGLHMVDLSKPAAPTSAGCFGADGYTHDVECVIYSGPDAEHQGREICFASNEDTLTVVDVTNKAAPRQLSRSSYAGVGYTHQGSLTENQRFFVADDELDELQGAPATRTYVWDVADLESPFVDFIHSGSTAAIDHNQYIRADRSYQANYKAGMRVMTTDRLSIGIMKEVAHFDTHPASDLADFDGAWSLYPHYRSNVVAVSTIDRGLFVLGYAGEQGSLHVGDLDSRSVVKNEDKWRAIGKVEVHDEQGSPVAGATVTMRWANGRIKTCVTGPRGRCKTAVIRYNRDDRVGFRVLDLEHGDKSYASWLNEDPDSDSNGFRDTVRRPTP